MIKYMLMLSFIASLLGCSVDPAYEIKNGSVYFQNPNFKDLNYQKDVKKLEGADAKSFQVLKGGSYAKDTHAVYYQGNMISGAEAASFVAIDQLMGKDRNHGYFMETSLAGSDGKTFIKLTKMYSKDKSQAYYGKQVIKGADALTFEIIDEPLSVFRDGTSYYKFNTKLPIEDYQSFVQVSGDFWKDRHHVYHISNPINSDRVILQDVDV